MLQCSSDRARLHLERLHSLVADSLHEHMSENDVINLLSQFRANGKIQPSRLFPATNGWSHSTSQCFNRSTVLVQTSLNWKTQDLSVHALAQSQNRLLQLMASVPFGLCGFSGREGNATVNNCGGAGTMLFPCRICMWEAIKHAIVLFLE